MFYAQFVLAKKGPLAKIWLAAHWEKKLTKAQICETDVPQAIEEVIRPKVKMALRTVGHLLLGIVRIYSKKTRYLLADTNEAYVKMRVNFRDGFSFETDVQVDADIEENFANNCNDYNITVPEFHDADYNEQLIMANVSRLEDITIRDDVNYNAMFQINVEDDGFGDEADYGQIEQLYGSLDQASLRPTPQPESLMEMARDATAQGSVLSNHDDGTIHLSEGERRPIFPMDDLDFGGVGEAQNFDMKAESVTALDNNDANPLPPADMFASMVQDRGYDEPMDFGFEPEAVSEDRRPKSPESFALEPLDIENMEEGRKKRVRKPRKLLVDAETMISNDAFRAQQEDFTDTMQPVTMAPPSRKMHRLCITGEMSYLMRMPGTSFRNKELLREYQRLLVPRRFDPNFTMAELSESSSSAPSMDRHSGPWEDLELNEDIPLDIVAAPGGGAEEDYYRDIDMDENYAHQPEMNFDATLGHHQEDVEFADVPANREENKENEEELDWSDPFGSVNKRGRLEDYGFGSSTIQKTLEDEGKWAKRANQILKQVSLSIETTGQALFSTITSAAKNRKQAAEQFYSLLSLAKSQAITVEQAEPYGEIIIRTGVNYEEALNPQKDPDVDVIQRTPMRTPMRPI